MLRDQFTFYRSYYEALKHLPKRDQTAVLMAVIGYALDEQEPNLSGVPLSVFTLIRPTLDSGRNKAKNRINKSKTNEEQNNNKSVRNEEQTSKEKEREGEREGERENDSSPPKSPSERGSKKFIPPTVDEVRDYCRKMNYGIDPESFVSFYASKGWMIGKNHMKDWRQATTTWETKRRRDEPQKPEKPKPPEYRTETDPETGEEVIVWLK